MTLSDWLSNLPIRKISDLIIVFIFTSMVNRTGIWYNTYSFFTLKHLRVWPQRKDNKEHSFCSICGYVGLLLFFWMAAKPCLLAALNGDQNKQSTATHSNPIHVHLSLTNETDNNKPNITQNAIIRFEVHLESALNLFFAVTDWMTVTSARLAPTQRKH